MLLCIISAQLKNKSPGATRIFRQLRIANSNLTFERCKSDDIVVKISNVSKVVKPAKNPEFIPRKYLLKEPSQSALKDLKWMLQKDILGQDMFLMGSPGSKRRNLAMAFLELTGREVEFIALSQDTTESDLKQRREIESGTAKYHDQSAVRAAINGRALIVEGVEKAERNVLPVLNNLLENREMHLEDGRFLIPASRYDKLLEEHGEQVLDSWKLVRVSEDFRVIALGLPVQRYAGHPLDPPLRSRFQARHIDKPSFQEQLRVLSDLLPEVDKAKLSQLLSCCHALVTPEAISLGIPDFPIDVIPSTAPILKKFEDLPIYDVFYRLYPYKLFLNKEGKSAVEDILNTFSISNGSRNKKLSETKISSQSENDKIVITVRQNGKTSQLQFPREHVNEENLSNTPDSYIETKYQNKLLVDLMQSHLAADFCLIGPKGCGKSITIEKLANLLGYEIEPIVLYQDMTCRDLIQQRTTQPNGDTVWRDSPLVTAALEGKLAVLDGLHRIHPSTLAVIHRLVHDRELQLHDGKRLINSDRYNAIKSECNLTDEDLKASGILQIHPSFRIAALAEPPNLTNSSGQWLNSELLSLFLFHEMRPLGKSEELHIIKQKFGEPSESLLQVVELAHNLRKSEDPTLKSLSGSLSTRQILRIAARMSKFPTENAYEAINRACLARFLPNLPREALGNCLKQSEIQSPEVVSSKIDYQVTTDSLKIGETTINRHETTALTKVPNILFYDVPQHLTLMEKLLQDFIIGEHLLLVGNQGVGKNKIVDRLLQLMNRPREYIQLHRDTTVQTLTLQPNVRDGIVVYEDSPLVQAVKLGHVLVVDEADKAPTHVTCILKTLIQSGEMILSDGRRIVRKTNSKGPNYIEMHPDFRMIVLANRPGFPFLGNDFFSALGDLFSTHSVDNPSFDNEIQLLKQYGPDVDDKTIRKLVKAFGELRTMADQGLVAYPYSTREVVNVVKHLQKFPNEPLAVVVSNVFDFDRYSREIFETLVNVLHKHGIPIGTSTSNVALAKEIPLPPMISESSGCWRISSDKVTIPVQEKYIKLKKAHFPTQRSHVLDKIEARSQWFTELESYWTLPLSESSIVSALSVLPGPKDDATGDVIYILSANPLTIFKMTLNSTEIKELPIHGLINPARGNKPQYCIAPIDRNSIIVHEETSKTRLLVNFGEGSVEELQHPSLFENTSERLNQAFGKNSSTWKMLVNPYSPDPQVVFYSSNGNKIEVVNLQNMSTYCLTLPCNVDSILITSSDKWLIQDEMCNRYVLQKHADSSPCPSELRQIDENNDKFKLGRLLSCSSESLGKDLLSEALQQKIDAPNRLLSTAFTYAGYVVGFPELESPSDVHVWPRQERSRSFIKPLITERGHVISTIPPERLPKEVDSRNRAGIAGYLEVVDTVRRKIRYIPIPEARNVSPAMQWLYHEGLPIYAAKTSNDGLVTLDGGGCVRVWETSLINIEKSLGEWRRAIGEGEGNLQITKERYSGLDVSGPKHGKVDEKNEPHVGGNTWAGGTGGRDTAGLGGKGGPYRLDAGHTVHQLSDEEKNAVPEHVKKAAREMGIRAFKQRLKDIRMSEYDHKLYQQYSGAVQKQVQSLRVILGSLQAKRSERQWLKHQTTGELDDMKLIEGLTGEKTIYRRRAEKEPDFGSPQLKPKRLKLVVDVSGSMYRFNGYDGRLDREMEACVMVMEAFSGHEGKFQYDIVGHSGDDYQISFVHHSQPPADNKQRLEVIKTMHAHSQFCLSGDNTLTATKHAIASLAKEDSDESIVVVLSDANLDRYGIPPERFAKTLTSVPEVNAYAIFIGSLGDQAQRLTKRMPAGRAFVCMDLKDIPRILQQIFTASVLSATQSD